ncbi:MAG TPA: PrsW family glutamic-type intramembrane protease [Pirellulales bacterium]|nr:PrsW family glutamic-type intramembrane protease [Pirellulales bacterium]
MKPIYVMAAVTTALALAAWGTLFWQTCPRDRRRLSLVALLVTGFFMSPAAFFVLRRPLLSGPLEPVLKRPAWSEGNWSIVRDAIRLAYAPLTEEPAKLLPWFVLLAAGRPLWPTRRMIAPLAMAAGLGFAVGEIWLVASFVAESNDPKLAGLPWYSFGGFLSERLMTCMAHVLFAMPAVTLARRGRLGLAAGLAIGMGLHGLSNSAIVLMHRGAFGWQQQTWQLLIQLWLVMFVVAGLAAVLGAFAGRKMWRAIWSRQMVCPGCGEVYRQPILLGLNFGMSRYEPCGVCHKWHWVTLKDLAPVKTRQNVGSRPK